MVNSKVLAWILFSWFFFGFFLFGKRRVGGVVVAKEEVGDYWDLKLREGLRVWDA